LFELIGVLKDWQELVGAILGAIGALLVAFIVAGSAQRRAERVAAMVVTGYLVDFLGLAVKLEYEWSKLPNKAGILKDDWIGERVLWMWTGSPADLDTLRLVLSDAEDSLAIRLTLLSQCLRAMNDVKQKFDNATGDSVAFEKLRPQYAKFRIGLEAGGPLAYASIRIIEKFILSKRWRWNHFLRKLGFWKDSDAKLNEEFQKLKPDSPWPASR